MKCAKVLLGPAAACAILFCGMGVPAAEPLGVSLMRPDSLAGWDYGDPPPRGWTIAEGRLSGSAECSPLLSGWTFGEFELRFGWSVAGGGAWKISLPEVPSGKGLELILVEGDRCGQLTDGDRQLAAGGKLSSLGGKMHTAAIGRAGGKLSLTVDGKRFYEVGLDAQRRLGLGLAVPGGQATLAELRLKEPRGKQIFNGQDLSGWWTPGDIDSWTAKDGQIVWVKPGGSYIRTEKEYANFTLACEYKLGARGNSGIGIRTPQLGWPSSDGMEMQLFDRPYDVGLDKHQTMAIYGNVPPLARADIAEKWNRVVIKADGWMISAWINGQLVQQYNAFCHPELKHRHLAGWIGFQDHKSGVQFRNVYVLEAPDGLGLDAWYKPLPPLATTAVIDQLMNPERLSAADGITSGVVSATVSGEEQAQHVLAELTGPGAVVRVARNNADGQLAFYFDGQQTPRLQCKPGDLWKAAPEVSEDANPVLTCLSYKKTLKVVLRDAKQAEYRIDYVTFPANLQVETFGGPEAGFPRGWLSAVAYRHLQHKAGTVRDYDPFPRAAAEKKTIQPGKRRQLVHVEGAGVVEWLKLQAGKKLLDNDDLWLEVTVDGEKKPAVSAPARYWFPGLAGQGNFHNFVFVDRGGMVNRLAMPFGNGITISARNRGEKSIKDVGLTISYQQASDRNRDDILRRMRLRGVFQPAQEGKAELVSLKGAGRWVALVYQQPDDDQTGIDSLLVDGKSRDGWSAPNLQGFLGYGENNFRTCLSGRRGPLCWRYLMLEAVDFQKSLVLKAAEKKLGQRLVLYYAR